MSASKSVVRLTCFTAVVCLSLAEISHAEVSKKVLMIGIDGAGGRYVVEANTPHMDALATTGAARYDFLNEGALVPDPPGPYGASGVNWSTILTGVSAEHHGVSDNSFGGSKFDQYPHFFQHVKQHDSSLYTASLANWTPINTFITPDAYADLEIGYDSGSGVAQDTAVKDDTLLLLQTEDPDAIFLHFDHVDGAGHSSSWGSPAHLSAIETVDSLIGEIVAAIDSRPGVIADEEDWLILITADHGAARGATGHTADQGPENWEVPFIANGPSIVAGTALQQGTLRDLAPTALWHLGIDPFAAGLDGTVRGLTVEPPSGVLGDINGDGLLLGDGSGSPATDDVRAFVDHWLQTGSGSIAERYSRGDINFDGITDLGDWAILNRLDPSMGRAVALALGNHVPEPKSVLVGLLAIATMLLQQYRHTRRAF